MLKYYTRACNFYYGKQAQQLIRTNKALPLCGNKRIAFDTIELFTRKNQDYGDAFANYGPIGVIVRIGDKIQRLSSITKNSITLVKDEGIRDTLIDLHNYAAMALMLLDESTVQLSKSTPDNNADRIE